MKKFIDVLGADYASAQQKGCQNFNLKTVADPRFFKGRAIHQYGGENRLFGKVFTENSMKMKLSK